MSKEQLNVIDEIEDIMTMVTAINVLTEQIIDLLPNYPDEKLQISALDVARIATGEKLDATLARLSDYLHSPAERFSL
jgi:hypothetical protein